MKFDLQQEITNKIVAQLENGTPPWVKPWNTANPSNVPINHALKPYRGINILLLWATPYSSARWMTYKQASALGGQVRRGEKGTQIVWAGKVPKKENPEDSYFTMKYYTVFNEDQIDGIAKLPVRAPVPADPFFESVGARVIHKGGKAFYSPQHDIIQMPFPEDFASPEDYQATKAHELIHWTGHSTRLDRKLKNAFGSEDYAKEELVAELGSAFLCSYLGISMEPRPDHASYIASWLKALKGDKKYIFQASSLASKAVEFLTVKETVNELETDPA